MKILPVSAILVIILVSAFFLNGPIVQNSTAQTATGTSNLRRFGFGFVGGWEIGTYGADLFFRTMFLTPPYPSTIQITLDNGICDLASYNTVIHRLMADAAPYPNIKMGISVAFDASNNTQWAIFTPWLNALRADPNYQTIGFVGFAIEQLNIATTTHNSTYPQYAFALMQSKVSAAGYQFISYYPQGLPSGSSSWSYQYLFMAHTNYPQGDSANILDAGIGQSNIAGITHGTDGHQIFPQIGCNFQGMPNWSTVSFPNGYLPTVPGVTTLGACNNIASSAGFPPTIDQALNRDNSNPIANRQWDFFIAGTSGTQETDGYPDAPFVGVSGLRTSYLWDHPVFRQEMSNWVASNPNTFVTSTGGVPPVLSTTSTSTYGSITSSTSHSETHTTTSTTTLATSISTSSTSMTSSSTHVSTTSSSTHVSTTSSTSHSETHTTTSTTTLATSISTSSTSTALTTTSTQASATSSNPPSITLTLSQGGGTAVQGGVFSTALQVLVQGALTRSLSLSGAGVPRGFNVTFSPSQAYSSFESTMSIRVSPTVGPGAYSFEVLASCGAVIQSASFTLAVTSDPSPYVLQLSASPAGGGTTSPSPGEHAYPPGTTLTVAALPESNDWVFDHWDLNGNSAGTSDIFSITVSQNNSVLTACFKFQPGSAQETAEVAFLPQGYSGGMIGIDGRNYSLPTSFTWSLGSSHNITGYSVSWSGSRAEFVGWSNVQAANSTNLLLVTNQSLFVLVNYRQQVSTKVLFLDSSGRELDPQNATLIGPAGQLDVRAGESLWLLSGAQYFLSSALIMGAEVVPSGASAGVIVGGSSGTIVFPLLVYDAQIKVVDIFGMPLQGALVSLTTINGQNMNASTDNAGNARLNDIPYGIYSADVSYMGISYRISQSSMGDNPVTMTLTLSYPLAAAVLVVASLSFYTLIRRMRKKTYGLSNQTGYRTDMQ